MTDVARTYLKVLGWYNLTPNAEYKESHFNNLRPVMDLADTVGLHIDRFTINESRDSSAITITITL